MFSNKWHSPAFHCTSQVATTGNLLDQPSAQEFAEYIGGWLGSSLQPLCLYQRWLGCGCSDGCHCCSLCYSLPSSSSPNYRQHLEHWCDGLSTQPFSPEGSCTWALSFKPYMMTLASTAGSKIVICRNIIILLLSSNWIFGIPAVTAITSSKNCHNNRHSSESDWPILMLVLLFLIILYYCTLVHSFLFYFRCIWWFQPYFTAEDKGTLDFYRLHCLWIWTIIVKRSFILQYHSLSGLKTNNFILWASEDKVPFVVFMKQLALEQQTVEDKI